MKFMSFFLGLILAPCALSGLCEDFKDYVLCQTFDSSNCTSQYRGVLTVKKVHLTSSDGPQTLCKIADSDKCVVTFVVSFKMPLFPLVFVERTKACPKPEKPKCIGEENGLICSGHGRCVDGLCQCYYGYYGKFCETCKYCSDYCNDLKYCIQCKVFATGPLCSTNCSGCLEPRLTDYPNVLVPQMEQQCRFVDDNFCTVSFVYSNFGGSRKVFVDANKKCDGNSSAMSSAAGSPCIGPNGLYCSGRGFCINEEKCRCRQGFHGKFCEKCHSCQVSCSDHVPCILCRLMRTGPLCGKDCSERCFMPILVDDIWSKDMSSLQKCHTTNDNGCLINFAFKRGTNEVYVSKQVHCKDSFQYIRNSLLHAANLLDSFRVTKLQNE